MSEKKKIINFILKHIEKTQKIFFLGSLSSVEKSGRFVVVKSSDVSDSNDNGNY